MKTTTLTNTVKTYIQQFDEELVKANQSYDYRTLARKIQGIASEYNAVVRRVFYKKEYNPKNDVDTHMSYQDSSFAIILMGKRELVVLPKVCPPGVS